MEEKSGKKLSYGKLFLLVAAVMVALTLVVYFGGGMTGTTFFTGEITPVEFCADGQWYQWDLTQAPMAVDAPTKLPEDGVLGEETGQGLIYTDPEGTAYVIPVETIQPESLRVSASGKRLLGRTEEGTLYFFYLKDGAIESYQEVDQSVTAADFVGRGEDAAYFKQDTFFYTSGGIKGQEAEHVLSFAPANDANWIYLVQGAEEGDTVGELVLFISGQRAVLDQEVIEVSYLGSGTAAYRKADGTLCLARGEETEQTAYQATDIQGGKQP